MASQGPLSTGTTADDSTIGGTAWSNANNSQTSDDSYATVTLVTSGDISHYLKATNFGFSIPSGATINGIVAEFERKMVASITDQSIRIVKGGSIVGTDQSASAAWPTSDTYATFGSSSNLWGMSWTDTDINATTFGVVIACIKGPGGSQVASIDHVRMTVYYTEVATTTSTSSTSSSLSTSTSTTTYTVSTSSTSSSVSTSTSISTSSTSSSTSLSTSSTSSSLSTSSTSSSTSTVMAIERNPQVSVQSTVPIGFVRRSR